MFQAVDFKEEVELLVQVLANHEFRRILIIKPSSFGDVIHALPVLNGLRKRYPDAHISWLVSESCAGLLTGHPQLDEVIRFDRVLYARLGRSWRATSGFAQFCAQLARRHFDLVVDLQGLFRSGFMAYVSGAPVRLGFANARELSPLFYSRRVRIPPLVTHATDRYYLMADQLGFAHEPISFVLPDSSKAGSSVTEKLRNAGISADAEYAVIAPGTRWETKRWPPDRFAQIGKFLQSQGLTIVLIGMPDEAPVANEVSSKLGGAVVNLAGQTNLAEVIALIRNARVSVMHDSGPMHLATALNRPMVAIYGPTSPALTGPFRRPDAIARHPVQCSPCRIKKIADCPHGHRCMQGLDADRVLSKLETILAERGRSCPTCASS